MLVRDPNAEEQATPAAPAWFVAISGQQRGPVSVSELATLVSDGQVGPESLVWTAGMPQWARAGGVEALALLFAPAPPPLPPPLPSRVTSTLVRPVSATGPKAKVNEGARNDSADGAKREARPSADAEAASGGNLFKAQIDAQAVEWARAEAEALARRRAETEALAKTRAMEEAQARAEQEARAKAEQEARARAEQEARARAEQEARARAEEEARARAEQEARARAEEEARARAEEEARARAEEEARARAEEEAQARAKAEEEAQARAKAEEEARARAEEEARARAEAQLFARAQAEAKARAESEVRAEAEARAKAAEARAKADVEAALATVEAQHKALVAAREKADADARAKAREEAEAAALALVAAKERELAEVKARATRAAEAETAKPSLSSASQPLAPAKVASEPTSPVGVAKEPQAGLDDDPFFRAGPPSSDIFSVVDNAPAAPDGADFRKTMRAARPGTAPRVPTRAEMRALRDEFSMVGRLQKAKSKRWVRIGLIAALVTATVIGIVLVVSEKFGGDSEGGPSGRKLYKDKVAVAPNEEPVVEEAEEKAPEPTEVKEQPKVAIVQPRASTEVKPKVETAKPPVERGDKLRAMTPEQYAALTEDETGKSEFKLGFDSNKLADKARAEAEEKKAQKATELTEQVVGAFAKKKAQFAKCSDGTEERVRVYFTVSTMGKVSSPKVEGTKNSTKSGCIEGILSRSIFPAGAEPLTYSQTLVL